MFIHKKQKTISSSISFHSQEDASPNEFFILLFKTNLYKKIINATKKVEINSVLLGISIIKSLYK